jgi:hypothetical protein
VAAIHPPSRSGTSLPAWAGTVGLVLGSALGAAGCYALASALNML